MRKPIIYIILIYAAILPVFAQNSLEIFNSQTYFEFMDTSIKNPISYEEINECAGLLYQESGVASYYARRFHGRKTANGELFNNKKMTIAHKTLPFGSIVQIRQTDTDSSILVRVNDRGPFVSDRIIDLSTLAAERLHVDALTEVTIKTIIPNEDFFPINYDYYFAFSYLLDPMCIESTAFTVLEEVHSFDKALGVLDFYITANSNRDFYLCVPANEYNKKAINDDDFIYYIAKINRDSDQLLIKD